MFAFNEADSTATAAVVDHAHRVERALEDALAAATAIPCPPRLAAGIRHAVFPGGGRLRPRLLLAVVASCGDPRPELADAAAAAVELIHCASLVHDDLPCFDDAELRRGAPSVHARFGEATALLTGDALLVLAFETLARRGASAEALVLASAAGSTRGLIAGQAWEGEDDAPLEEYHRAKTAALFEASARLGALISRVDADPWSRFGEAVGRAYQAADDLADAERTAACLGKTTGKDAALGRPSMVRAYGVDGARQRARTLLFAARASIPRDAETLLVPWVDLMTKRLGG